MRHRDANKIKYRLTLPVIILLSLTAIYFFHSIVIANKVNSNIQEKLNKLNFNSYRILSKSNGTDYNLHAIKFLMDDIIGFPETYPFYSYLHDKKASLFPACEKFISAASAQNHAEMHKTAAILNKSIGIVSQNIANAFARQINHMIKLEYMLLFLIFIATGIHYYFIDSPMRDELKKNTREKEVSKSTIRKLAERDILTNLPGRMKFYEDSEREISAAIRYNSDLALLKLDIHDFKEINKKYGQKSGDKLLAGFSRLVRKNLRRPDSFYRMGGDKFIIIAPHTTIINAQNLSEKLLKVLESSKLMQATPFALNIGIAKLTSEDSPESLLRKVDKALKKSKSLGAGNITTYSEKLINEAQD